MSQLNYSFEELMAEHDYARKIRHKDKTLHGGLLADGTYRPPRSLNRTPAIEAWWGRLKREGQAVEAGDVLLELDSRSAQADVDRLGQELATAQQAVARFAALSARLDRDGTEDVDPGWASDDSLLVGQWREFQDRLVVLQRERERLRAEAQSARRQVAKLQAILPIITRRAADRRDLAARKLLPEQQYLEAEQLRLETYHDLQGEQDRVAGFQASIEGLDSRSGLARSEFSRQVLERLEEAERRRIAAEQELIKARGRLRAHTITAPVAGVVQQLSVHNTGAIVRPAEALMVIVPRDAAVEVEAALENKDIGFVEPGLPVEIKVDTFPFTRHGTVEGEVTGLSHDAVTDPDKGLVYTMRVKMQRPEILVQGRRVPLTPGMTVTVECRTGTRRLIEFFLDPLLRYRDESVRER